MIYIGSQYKYNELAYAELISKNGFQTSHLFTELKLLALYYKQVLGYKPKQRREQVLAFCEEYIPLFNRAKYYKIINQALSQADKPNACLIVVDKIPVYKKEMDYIRHCDTTYEIKKVLFTFLIQWKINQKIYTEKNKKEYTTFYFKGGKSKYNTLKKMSNISNKLNINTDIISELNDKHLITVYHNGLISLEFLKECLDLKGDSPLLFEIKGNYQDIGYWYEYYNPIVTQQNHNIDFCQCCGSAYIKKKNVQKYCCDECAAKQKSIQDHNRYVAQTKTSFSSTD